jgi:branched-subunit amino acid aminotransferase/4-amino-4-deoxychorismate lyase
VFIVRHGALLTPPASEGALEGITRRSVLELARGLESELGLRVHERALARADLLDADEVFLTGSGAGVAKVASLDGVRIGGQHRSAEASGTAPDSSSLVSARLERALVELAKSAGVSFRAA